MPEWLNLDLKSPSLFRDANDEVPAWKRNSTQVIAICKRNNVPIIPLIHNVIGGTNGTFDWGTLAQLLASPGAQEKLAENLRDYVVRNKFGGINIDFEEPWFDPAKVTPQQRAEARRLVHVGLPHFMVTLNRVFHKSNLLVTQDIPAVSGDFDYAALNDPNDFVIAMLYNEHQNTPKGNPGTIASQPWVEDMAENIFEKMDSSKVVLGVGNYCYDWPILHDAHGDIQEVPEHPGEIAFCGQGKLRSLAAALEYAGDADAPIQMDPEDLNPYFTYVDELGQDRIVFMLDAVTAYNEIMALKGYYPRGAALWYMGSEDPSIWKFLSEGRLGKPIDPRQLKSVQYTAQVVDSANADGEIMDQIGAVKRGVREISFDKDGLISQEQFTEYPRECVIQQFGNRKGELALTFDDGPDPKYSEEILATLKHYHVPGTFFVIGRQAERYPGIVKDEWDAGCEIGNHTFTHQPLPQISPLRADLEINATQRTIESIIGHSTKLIRPPYDAYDSTTPVSSDLGGTYDPAFLESLHRHGYLAVGNNIDGFDYKRPGVDEIVSTIESEINTNPNDGQTPKVVNGQLVQQNNIILMHDGSDGGHVDRQQTVDALGRLIPDLEKKGYKFVRVSDLLGPREHERLFPVVANTQERIAGFDRVIFEFGFGAQTIITVIFLLSIFLGVGRVLVVSVLAIVQARRSKMTEPTDFAPPVSVIIPAYNEEKVVCRTVRSILKSDYQNLEVIVVDDGSADRTAQRVEKTFGSDPRVTVLKKENGGKSSALNLGISMVSSEIIICLDADTLFARDTISRLVPHFADLRVGAVAGNVKVGNRTNPLTIWQSVEYITSQNFDRRAYAALNSVSVVPGAVGAWRKSAVVEAGAYSTDTLAEDTDLTFRVRLLGYHVLTENDALAFTEAPDSVRELAKQRFRWAFGTLQSLWKHRTVLFKRKHGAFTMFVMPAMWLYNIFLQAFAPVVDIAVLIALFSGQLVPVLSYYAAFFVLDFFGAALAIGLDHEDPKQLVWLFWQRFFYRQFMYYVILKSIVAALRGHMVGWGKLQRKATVVGWETSPK
jgi:cellulose synthase/poly-beta-1,6-N-acetylglucosamine synthase-like glycosyltransferase/peptidoglycan/xylan/chitin deacetylase (PgdA/CDA1 family)/spore germination protein YaaH